MTTQDPIVILGYARTPIGNFLGCLQNVPMVDLAVTASQAAIKRSRINLSDIEELALGCVYKHGCKGNPARQIQLKLGIPARGWAYTIDQQCASGLKAVDLIRRSLLTGGCKVGLAVGADNMSRAPYLDLSQRRGARMGNTMLYDTLTHEGLVCAIADCHMGMTAENLAEQYHITRREQDELALLSHTRACKAIRDGKLDKEIAPVEVRTKKSSSMIDKDEHPKFDITLESLSALPPAFKDGGTVTAGNSSSINDAAAALVLSTASYANAHGLKPIARILSSCSCGVAPEIMGIGPVYAVPKAIEAAGLTNKDIDYYELNEAFAAQFLACSRKLELTMDKVNANGSGISLGHPVGCTGIRVIISAITELQYRRARYGVASVCVGGGPAMAAVIELL